MSNEVSDQPSASRRHPAQSLPQVQTQAPVNDFVDFPELWRTLNRHKWGVIGIAVLAAVLGALWALRMDPVYRASATLKIEPHQENVVPVQRVYEEAAGRPEHIHTQTQIIRSRHVIGRVVDRLDLTTHPDFTAPPNTSLYLSLRRSLGGAVDFRRWLPFLPPEEEIVERDPDPNQIRESAINRVLGGLNIAHVPGTYLIGVHFDSTSRELATLITNEITGIYIESSLDFRLDTTERASRWLTDRLSDIEQQLAASERRLNEYREQQELIDVGGVRRPLEEEVAELSARLRDAGRKRQQLASTYWRIREAGNSPGQLEEISTLLLDPVVQKAKEDVLRARAQMRQARERYGTRHPELLSAQASLENAESGYREQLRIAAEGVQAEFEIARENERAFAGSLEDAKLQLRQLDRQQHESTVLERQVETNRELHQMFLSRFRETDMAGEYRPITARVIDPATQPQRPHKPNKRRITLFSGLLGLLLGFVLAVIRHLLDEGVRSVEDLEALTGRPTLGILPIAGRLKRQGNLPEYFRNNPRKAFSEGVRSVRAAIQLNDVDQRMKRLLVTSSVPNEGKTSLAGSLAEAFGAMERVVLVEADLRVPTLRKLFKIPMETPDIIQVLMGEATLEQALFRDESSGVDLLTVEAVPKNPAEIVASQAFARLVAQLTQKYDRVILDSPPCQAASDAAMLSRNADGVVFVVRSESTNRRVVKAAIKQLQQAHVPVLGCVINQVDPRKNRGYYDSYYYAYGYYGRG